MAYQLPHDPSTTDWYSTEMSVIQYQVQNGVAVITLNRPEKRNAQNLPFLHALNDAWTRAAADDEAKVVLLLANGKHFSAGHDMEPNAPGEPTFEDRMDFKTVGLSRFIEEERAFYLGYCQRWRDMPKPSIAAVQGACIAAGLMLIWPCDLIIAAEDAWFMDPVIAMGVGGVEYQAHTWEFGARRAKDFLFTGRRMSAREAFEIGMVSRVVPTEQLPDAAMGLAAEIAKRDAFALAMTKRAVNQTIDIMGFTASLNAAFNVHHLAHANAYIMNGGGDVVLDMT